MFPPLHLLEYDIFLNVSSPFGWRLLSIWCNFVDFLRAVEPQSFYSVILIPFISTPFLALICRLFDDGILADVRWCLVVVLICNSLIVIDVHIFSYVFCSSVCPFWRNFFRSSDFFFFLQAFFIFYYFFSFVTGIFLFFN